MKIIRHETKPKDFDNGNWFEISAFNDEELKYLYDLQIDIAVYWYAIGDYEGLGQILAKKHGIWYHHDCRHCSCGGPTEEITLIDGETSIDALLERCTQELQKELQPLVYIIKKENL